MVFVADKWCSLAAKFCSVQLGFVPLYTIFVHLELNLFRGDKFLSQKTRICGNAFHFIQLHLIPLPEAGFVPWIQFCHPGTAICFVARFEPAKRATEKGARTNAP